MKAKRRLSEKEVQRLIKPVVSDLLRKVHGETAVLDQRTKMMADLSHQIRKSGDKLQSQLDPLKLEEWGTEAVACIERIVQRRIKGIEDEIEKEIISDTMAEQLRLAISSKLLFAGGKTAAKKWAIALAVSAGAITCAIAVAAVLRDGETGEQARQRMSDKDSP